MANQSCGIGCTFQLGFGSSSAGVFVQKVKEDGPAAAAGISSGDRLLGFFLDSKVSLDPPYPPPLSIIKLEKSIITEIYKIFIITQISTEKHVVSSSSLDSS